MDGADIFLLLLMGSPVVIGWFMWLARRGDRGRQAVSEKRTPIVQGGTSRVAYAPWETDDVLKQEIWHMLLGDAATRITIDYGAVLETLQERSKRTGMSLHPESLLPYPKEVIRSAFAIIIDLMERRKSQQWRGVSKEVFLGAWQVLEERFAPDAEVPEDPVEILMAFYRWQDHVNEPSPFDVVKFGHMVKANPKGWERIFERAGITKKEYRELLISTAIAQVERSEGTRDTRS
jgi:hypothetical protein